MNNINLSYWIIFIMIALGIASWATGLGPLNHLFFIFFLCLLSLAAAVGRLSRKILIQTKRNKSIKLVNLLIISLAVATISLNVPDFYLGRTMLIKYILVIIVLPNRAICSPATW